MGQATAGQYSARERKSLLSSQGDSWKDRSPTVAPNNKCGVDTELFKNAVEMIPLVETFRDQQNCRAFSRHASLVHSPTHVHDAWSIKKTVEYSAKGKNGHDQRLHEEHRGFLLWKNPENVANENQNLFSREIPMLLYPSDRRLSKKGVNTLGNTQLESRVEKLEYRLEEKERELQAAERHAQQTKLQLQQKVERLENKIQERDRGIQRAEDELLKKQCEVSNVKSLLEKAEAKIQSSKVKDNITQEESSLHCHLMVFALQLHNILFDSQTVEEVDHLATSIIPSLDVTERAQHVDMTRRKYEAAVIAARENPIEELLMLAAEFRRELQALVIGKVL